MISFYRFTHRFKRSMLEIYSELSYENSWEPIPLLKEKLPDNIVFDVAAGKKPYDIIRRFEDRGYFFSQKVIDVFSQFIDMSDKCYPIKIKGLDKQYYVIYNLEACSYLNKNEAKYMYDPRYLNISDQPCPIFGIKGTMFIIVSEEVKNALLKSKISNVELVECFGCTRKEYEEIKKSKIRQKVHVYNDK